MRHVETSVVQAVQWLQLSIETISAVVIAVGIVLAVGGFLRALASRESAGFNRIRLTFARYLALALELQLGADILATAIAPSWDEIGKLGAIAVIRTALNYFLMLEMREENAKIAGAEREAVGIERESASA